ncbi:alpha/beta hydrolase [Teredinibacter turnerae]|uniref:alpha/beta hydrolase n=1 Tax=Teredinibacter turnerae TaxID=2426 RepID=UPI000379B299|nr:alpha/beta hydrolase-fold protein [Teredinibacter turnerae]
MRKAYLGLFLCFIFSLLSGAANAGEIIDRTVRSRILGGEHLGYDPQRHIKLYLPSGYATSGKRYPVLYHFHGLFWSNTQAFADGNLQRTLDVAMARGIIPEFIWVAGDYTTAGPGAFFENSAQAGRWLDHVVEELVPYVDTHFRTLATREARGLLGEFTGAYGALKVAMYHPELAASVYAMHPVGTGLGWVPMSQRDFWSRLLAAKDPADVPDGFESVFLAMAQAYLPRPDKPPFYADFIVRNSDGRIVVDRKNFHTLRTRFLLDTQIPAAVENLKQLQGIKLDWGRYDANQDHVLANQNFVRLLEDYGIEHEAEEYRGNGHDHWTNGRVLHDVLPFFSRMFAAASKG